ncbi:hypothetical protein conserved [Entamoeba histolytica]|uniref:DOCKER domain-containing protein n=4 Tax=Entamoeba histolytica TaxID=5759 RepID=C4M429_ENTH1|nr:hypothetical protein, conserved [Entamoeba histolytica HM-1:IMSS]EAL46386.1 hypothetical protein, conserved [Entamoeba histolytica HM-1:IMSS]ENY62641.1 hypothetical protein EHI7A_016710 [Entamoeba histolytica HM-1:IMSS-A]GAT96101.1 hypothetical protein conserved [Entamoeba histolytica]|eukprot:XP_651772.1 hypothetical protein, conserved [Entamoeba histolytica HM-1:IMSS]
MKNKEQVVIDDIFEKNDFVKSLKLVSSPRLVTPRIKTSKQIKDQEQQRVLNIQFDEFDSEETEQLDIFQLRIFLESGQFPISSNQHLFVKEQNLREVLGSMFLDKSSRICRKEFAKFCNYFEQKRDEIEWNSVSLISLFSQADNSNVPNKFKTYPTNHITRFDLIHKQRLNKENIVLGGSVMDDYHTLIMNQFYQQTTTIQLDDNIEYITTEEKIRKNSLVLEPGKYNRREEMPCLFGTLFRDLNPSDLIKNEINDDVIKNKNIIYVIDLNNVVWAVGSIDNLILNFAIYDQSKKEKVSSNFIISPKQADVNLIMNNNVGETCAISLNESQIKNGKLWGVLTIYKLFDGESMEEIFIAEKESRNTLKIIEKMRQINVTQKAKGVQFLQYIATGAMALNNDLLEDRKSYYNLKLYYDDSIIDLWQFLGNVESGKIKPINGSWGFKFEQLNHYTKANLIITQDGVVQNVDSQPPEASEKENEEVPLLHDLVILKNINEIYHDFYNTLFISPIEVSIPKDKRPKNGGICLMFQLKSNDDLNANSIIKSFFPMNSMSPNLLDKVYSSVNYNKQTFFTDEIRVQLPFPLREKYHLLITVLFISYDDFSQKPMYYSVLPLFANGNVVSSMVYSLPLLKGNLTEGYLNQLHHDVTKMSINVKIDVQSTIYPKEKNIYRFLNGKMVGVERALESIPVQEAIHFLPSIVNYFIFHTKENSLGFFALFDIFAKIEGIGKSDSSRSKLLYDFTINFTIENQEESLVSRLLWQFLMKIKDDMEKVENVMKYSWILFTILFKGIVMMTNSGKKLDSKNLSYLSIGCQKFSSLIRKKIVSNSYKGVFEGNINLAEFISRLMGIIDNEPITSIIIKHLITLGSCLGNDGFTRLDRTSPAFVTLGICRTQFIATIGISKNFILFNKPQALEVTTIEHLSDEITQKHLVITYFIRELLNIYTREGPVGKIAIDTLLSILLRLDFDVKYQSKEDRCYIGNILFGILIYLLDEFDKIKDVHYNQFSVSEESINDIKVMYLCMFFVLKNISYSTMKSWLEKEIPTRIEIFLIHLRRALLFFIHFPCSINNPIEEIKDLIHTLKQSYFTQTNNRNTVMIEPINSFGKSISSKHNRHSGGLNTTKIPSYVQQPIVKSRINKVKNLDKIIEELSSIVMDYAEALFDRFENSSDNGQSLIRLEEIVATTLFQVHQNDEYTNKLKDFIRLLILRHKHFLFEGTSQFSAILLKNLLNLCNSSQESIRKNALDLVYIMVKYNFIFSQNISRSMSDCAVSLSELKYSNITLFRNLIDYLPSLAKEDFETSVKQIDELRHSYWEEGQKNINSLIHLQKINIGVEVGDLDVFLVFMNNVLSRFMKVIELIKEFHATPNNFYVILKSNIIKEIQSAMLFSQEDINALNTIKMNIGKSLEPMKEKIDDRITQYLNLQISLKEQKGIVDQEKEHNNKIKTSLMSIDTFFNKLPQWISLLLQDDSYKEIIENEKKNWVEWTNDISSLKEIDCITFSNFETLIHLIDDLRSQIKKAQQTDEEQTKVFEVLAQMNEHKMSSGINFIEQCYRKSMKDFNEINNREYDNNCIRVIDGLIEYCQFLEMKMARLRTDFDDSINKFCSFDWWCQAIESGEKLCLYCIELSQKYQEMKDNLIKKEEWHKKEVKYAEEVLKSYIWSTVGCELANIRMRESNDYVKAISSICKKVCCYKDKIKEWIKEAQEDYQLLREFKEESNNFSPPLNVKTPIKRRGKKTRKYTISSVSVITAIHHFEEDIIEEKCKLEQIEQLNKEFEQQAIKEIEYERIRNDYAITLHYLFTATEPFIQNPQMITQAVIKDVQTLSQRLIQAESTDDKYRKLNRYVDYSICKEPHHSRVSKIMSLFSDKLLGSSGPSTLKKSASGIIKKKTGFHSSGGSKKTALSIEKGNQFVDAEGEFNKDAFIDVSKSQQVLFEECLNELTTTADQILQKLADIKSLMSGSSPIQLVEKFMIFAHEYQSTARVHIAWIQRMIEEYVSYKMYCEAGICCVHIALYLGLPESVDKRKLKEICKEPSYDDITMEINKETLLTVVNKLKQASDFFKMANKIQMAIYVFEVLVSLFKTMKQYKELEVCHDSMCDLYNKLETESNVDHYYLINKDKNHQGLVLRSILSPNQFEAVLRKQGNTSVFVEVSPMKENQIVENFITTNTFCFDYKYEHEDDCYKISRKRDVITIAQPLPSILPQYEVVSIKQIVFEPPAVIAEKLQQNIEFSLSSLQYGPLPLKYIPKLIYPFEKIDILTILKCYSKIKYPRIFNLILQTKEIIEDSVKYQTITLTQEQKEMVEKTEILLTTLSDELFEIKKNEERSKL